MSQILSLIVLFAGVFLVVDALSHSLLTTPSPKLKSLYNHRYDTKQYRVQYDFKHHYINATRPEGVKDKSLDLICHENNLIDHYSNIVSSNPIYSSISNRVKKSKNLNTEASVKIAEIFTHSEESTTADAHRQ